MTQTITPNEARALIRLAVENAGRDTILGEIVAWNNTTENDITDAGDVWVSDPQSGHWLSDDDLVSFANFLAST